ncbi:MAG TPA: hypothetical protein VGP26_05435 [Actinophytocola sp.]|jgi:hypothetical protein|nr:hypothetical protein [Actinophytocola sp.]
MNRTSRIVVGGAVVGSVLFGSAAVAVAQEDPSSQPAPSEPGSVTITLSAEQVQALCDRRLPKIQTRTSKLVERIQGDENTSGSAAWLRARAKKESDAGRTETAQLLEERADRREGFVDPLNKINKWAADFSAAHCGSK